MDPQLQESLNGLTGEFRKVNESVTSLGTKVEGMDGRMKAVEKSVADESETRKREIEAIAREGRPQAGLPGFEGNKSDDPNKRFSLARAIRGHIEKWSGATVSKKDTPEYTVIHEYTPIAKAQTANVGSEGGFLVPMTVLDGFIPFLEQSAVAMAAGAPVMTGVTGGDLSLPSGKGGITVTRGKEGALIPKSQEGFGQVVFRRKQSCAYTEISHQLLHQTGKAQGIVEQLMAARTANRYDRDYFIGEGAAEVPLGLINHPNLGTTDFAGADYAGADQNITDKLDDMVIKLMSRHAYGPKNVFALNPLGLLKLRSVKDASGAPLLFDQKTLAAQSGIGQGLLWGHNFLVTTELTGGAANSHILFFNIKDTQFVIWDTLEIVASEHAAFQTGNIAIRCIGYEDSMAYHGESIQSGINWTT